MKTEKSGSVSHEINVITRIIVINHHGINTYWLAEQTALVSVKISAVKTHCTRLEIDQEQGLNCYPVAFYMCVPQIDATYYVTAVGYLSFTHLFTTVDCWFVVEFSAAPSTSPQQHSLDPLIMSQLRLLGSLLEMLADCHCTQTPSGPLGQEIWLVYHLCGNCNASWCDYATVQQHPWLSLDLSITWQQWDDNQMQLTLQNNISAATDVWWSHSAQDF